MERLALWLFLVGTETEGAGSAALYFASQLSRPLIGAAENRAHRETPAFSIDKRSPAGSWTAVGVIASF